MQNPLNSSNSNNNEQNATSFLFKHRRAHSEMNFRVPDHLDLSSDPYDAPSGSFEELGSEEDLFCTYMDINNLGSSFNNGGDADNGRINDAGDNNGGGGRYRHRHSNSVDSSSLLSESIEAKKAMAPEQLAELWNVDPKRAKRILANRQSATRSKERKARYMSELERKVQTLQTEATTLSAQLALFQRDTTGLYSENTELNLRLQAMEQQAQLSDALNEAVKLELERLRMATGEIASCSDGYNLGMHQVLYNQSNFFTNHQQPEPQHYHHLHHLHQSNMSNHRHPLLAAAHTHPFSETLQQDPLGRFQGLDISNRTNLHLVKSEGLSISASESSTTF